MRLDSPLFFGLVPALIGPGLPLPGLVFRVGGTLNPATSCGVRCRHSRGLRLPSIKVPMRMRMILTTGSPRSVPTSRIWRLRPSRMINRNQEPLPASDLICNRTGYVQ